MAKIRIGLVGCGLVSELHMYAYRRVYGVDCEVSAVAARGEHVVDFAARHQIPTVYRSFRDLIADAELDVVDIRTPPNLHTAMIVEAMQAGSGRLVSCSDHIILRSASEHLRRGSIVPSTHQEKQS